MKCTYCHRDMQQVRSRWGTLFLRCVGFAEGCRTVALLNQSTLRIKRGPFNVDEQQHRSRIRFFARRIVRAGFASSVELRDWLAGLANAPAEGFHLNRLHGQVLADLHEAMRNRARRHDVNRVLRTRVA